jgi:hypothetical protein
MAMFTYSVALRGLLTATLFVANMAMAECASPKHPGAFRLLNGVEGFKGQYAPEFKGAERIASLGFNGLWNPDQSRDSIPSVATIKRRSAHLGNVDIVYVDIEAWPIAKERDDEIRVSLSKYEKAMANIRASLGPRPCLGYYGVLPVVDFGRVVSASGAVASWKHENDLMSPLRELVDYLAPSLYTFTTDFEVWKAFAKAQIAEARRVAPRKPVFPFLWPRYHEGYREHALEFLPPKYLVAQLEYVHKCADGVILWEWGRNEQFDDRTPWIRVFEEFASSASNTVVQRDCD